MIHKAIQLAGPGDVLVVRLLAVATPEVTWTGRYPVAGADVTAIASEVVKSVLAAVPPPPPAKA